MEKQKEYYLGLDIGTDSVGYAVTDTSYNLLKFKGEPMWGTHLFEGGHEAAERRMHRTNRRRIDRRQQRVALVGELFAPQIQSLDPNFFIRRGESALFSEDTTHGVKIFSGEGITDKEYHYRYPTIHHLILELMTSSEAHDVRLVYMACAWLVAHRGHFLLDIEAGQTEKVLDFSSIYKEFQEYLVDQGYEMPWDAAAEETILEILQADTGVTRKKEAFKSRVFQGKKIAKEPTEQFPYNLEAVVGLLAGGKVKPKELYGNEAYGEIDSVSLQMGDEEFDQIVAELGENGELLLKLRSLFSCAQLNATLANKREGDPLCISSSKVAIYEQHKKDLKELKRIIKTYCPDQYNEIFREAVKGNYVAYSGNVKSCPEPEKVKKADKIAFCDFLKKKLKGLKIKRKDQASYEDIMNRLESYSFLKKQKDSDNRIVPQQLYRQELAAILKQAANYLPMLSQKDEDGLTVAEKILSIFDFRIPYYVGPLVKGNSNTSWIERKQGKIFPWNFADMVDLDTSERVFIDKMVNKCTYLPGENVLPANALLYEKFTVLNELNNLKINGREIPPTVKQELYTELFMQRPKVTVGKIKEYLLHHGYMQKEDALSGVDIAIKSSLRSYHIFKRLLDSGMLTEDQVEEVILHATYTEDRSRMRRWLEATYPQLPEEDVRYILRQKLKDFGRLSAMLLSGLYGAEVDSDGEAFTIIEALWNTNENLMQLLSGKYTFMQQVRDYCQAYYSEHPKKLTERLSEMYVANGAKRSIFRTLDILSDVIKATGAAPKKIFVEMARGGPQDQKGKRTESRKAQLLNLYKKVASEDAKQFTKALEDMGAAADNRLQDRKLYLYYLQLGKCAYTGRPIDLSRLADGSYNLEHIYPQSKVKDDSILNNLVLVESEANGQKQDTYPISAEIRGRMLPYWHILRENHLMTEEKFRRLTRPTAFTDEEKMGFINRQLVETRQSTKVIAALLKERYPETDVVYVKAGLVSEFRQEFDLLKCRLVNDLHHAKDAYLNIVVGNVYNERFTSKWFRLEEHYNVQAKKLFAGVLQHSGVAYWNGEADIARVKKTMAKNAVHLTRYAFFRKGGLFDQQPVKAAEGLVPLKKGLPTEKYGGYNKPSAVGFMLVRFSMKGNAEIMLVPVELIHRDQVLKDRAFAEKYAQDGIRKVLGKVPENIEIMLNGRILKVNTVFSVDGVKMALAGKSSGGRQIIVSPIVALMLPIDWEKYAKKLEAFYNKCQVNKKLIPDEQHDGISVEKNVAFYSLLMEKMNKWPFANIPGNQYKTLKNGKTKFLKASVAEQVNFLLNVLLLLGPGSSAVDMSTCGGAKSAGSKLLSARLSNWKESYTKVQILDESASGLFCQASENLMDQL